MKKSMEFTIPGLKELRGRLFYKQPDFFKDPDNSNYYHDEITDYAILIDRDHDFIRSEISTPLNRSKPIIPLASWYLRDLNKGRSIFKRPREDRVVVDHDSKGLATKTLAAICPMIKKISLPIKEFGSHFNYNKSQLVEYGEYPQSIASHDEAIKLDNLYNSNQLKKTSKHYLNRHIFANSHINEFYDEYYMDGQKYIRIQAPTVSSSLHLSNGDIYTPGDYYWIRVEPITWFYDKNNKTLISTKCLLSNMIIAPREEDLKKHPKKKLSKFENSSVYDYLNDEFKEQIKPSDTKLLYDIIWGGSYDDDETKPKPNEKNKAAESLDLKDSNPYGFSYDDVSEEEIIKGAIDSGIAVFLHGRSSDGKSARIKAIDPGCITIYLKNATPESLNGKSAYDSSTGKLYDIKPTWLEKLEEKCAAEPDKKHLVFFDEITNALPSLQGAAFNIVLDREVNGKWQLPENSRIVAAGNEMQDSLAANQIAEPLFNRFAHVYIHTTSEKWLIWASKNHIHPAIFAYISYRGEEVLRTEYNGETPNADPRKWEMASKMLYETNNPEMLRALIGEDLTKEFIEFCKQKVITLEDVIKGNYNDADIDDLNTAERFATTMTLTQVNEENIDSVYDFINKLGPEYLSVFDALWCIDDVNRKAIIEEKKGMRK